MSVRNILLFFVLGVLSVSSFLACPHALRAVTPGLIKGSGPVVFYLASNGRRYAFPNEQTFKTWYADFSQVRTISETELASYTYGGNVTYRPGTRLLKRRNDTKIYTVGQGGMLRWMMSPAIIQALYGQNWSRLVDELPDARVADYAFGEPVRTRHDVSPATERRNTPTIEQNRRAPRSAGAVSQPPPSSPLSVFTPSVPPTPATSTATIPPPLTPYLPPPPTLVAPTSFSVEEADRGVRLRWSDRSRDETGYRVERREGSAQTFVALVTLSANTEQYVDRTARVGVRYAYRVVALGSGGRVYVGEEQSITTLGTLNDRPGSTSSGSVSGINTSLNTTRVCWPGDSSCGNSSSQGTSQNMVAMTDPQMLRLYPGSLRVVNVANESALREAWSQARAGDVIRLASGTYNLSRQLWIGARGDFLHPIYFVPSGNSGSVTITVSGDEGINIGGGASYLILDGLKVQRTGSNVIHIQDGADHITLRNMILSDAGEDGDVVKINQASSITIEGSDLARPGRRVESGENRWQELIDVVDADDVVIRRNWLHDFGNMAGYVKGGSKNARIEENIISGQRLGEVSDPMWGIGGWTDRELLQAESYEALNTTFRRNILIGGVLGSLGIYDARDSLIEGNLFFQASDAVMQIRAGNAPLEVSEGVTIRANQYIDPRGTMPNVCEVQSHEVRNVQATANVYWNGQNPIPSYSDCDYLPGTETSARREDMGWRDLRPTSYEQATDLLNRL